MFLIIFKIIYVAQTVKNLPAMQETQVQSLGQEDPLEKEMAIHSSILFLSFFLSFFIVVVFAIHWHESAMYLHVFPIPIPPPASLSIPSLWVFPVHQARALVSCIQPGMAICFTLDNILVSMLFSQNIPTSPSPTESKSLFCTSVSLFLFYI